MKNGLLKIGVLGLILYGFYTVTIGRTLKRLELYLEDVGRISIKSGHMYLYMSLGVENPNKQNITINEINFDIYQQGKNVGRVTRYDANIIVPGRSRKTIDDIKARINLVQSASNLLRLFSKQTTDSDYKVTGYLKAGNMTIPVNKTITAVS